jgi:hypothetical protein
LNLDIVEAVAVKTRLQTNELGRRDFYVKAIAAAERFIIIKR